MRAIIGIEKIAIKVEMQEGLIKPFSKLHQLDGSFFTAIKYPLLLTRKSSRPTKVRSTTPTQVLYNVRMKT